MADRFDWDEAKRRSNLSKHGYDFARAADALWQRAYFHESQWVDDEAREVIFLPLDGNIIAIVAVLLDDDGVRLISMRRATKREQGLYYVKTS
ncbi:MAG: BrnT family toxin [Pseudomonadota bacterium]